MPANAASATIARRDRRGRGWSAPFGAPARKRASSCGACPSSRGSPPALFSVLVSQALAVRERDQFALLVETSARRVRAEIRAELDARMHAISILAREWQDRLLPRRGDWESDVRLILSQSPGLHSIAWVDATGEHSWAYPPETELPAIDLEKLRADGNARGAVMIGPVLPRDGEPRLRILAPLVERGAPRGWLAATYRAASCSRRSSRASTPRSRSTSARARSTVPRPTDRSRRPRCTP